MATAAEPNSPRPPQAVVGPCHLDPTVHRGRGRADAGCGCRGRTVCCATRRTSAPPSCRYLRPGGRGHADRAPQGAHHDRGGPRRGYPDRGPDGIRHARRPVDRQHRRDRRVPRRRPTRTGPRRTSWTCWPCISSSRRMRPSPGSRPTGPPTWPPSRISSRRSWSSPTRSTTASSPSSPTGSPRTAVPGMTALRPRGAAAGDGDPPDRRGEPGAGAICSASMDAGRASTTTRTGRSSCWSSRPTDARRPRPTPNG